MNEELRIIITAVTQAAQDGIRAVREELDRVNESGKESGVSVDDAMRGMAKGVAIAAAVITALTAAMVKLGQSAQNVEKGFSKLNTTFLNAGSTGAQAAQTYKELFSFLGDHDKAVETAQSLALITNEEEKLAEWTNILQGAFAEMGDKLPVEGLAEAANETIKVGQVTGVMADALTWLGISEDGYNEALANTTSLQEREALVRNTLNGLYGNAAKIYERTNQATIEYNQSQANLNIQLAEAAAYTTPLLTALNELGAVLLSVFGPALQTISAYLIAFIQLIAEAAQWVGEFFGMFNDGSQKSTANVAGYRAAMEQYLDNLRKGFKSSNEELDHQDKKLKEIKKQLMGFDELNVVSSQTITSGGSDKDPGGDFTIDIPTPPNPADYGIGLDSIDLSGFTKQIEDAHRSSGWLLGVIGAIGLGIAGWKLYDHVKNFKDLTAGARETKNVIAQLSGGLDDVSRAFGEIPDDYPFKEGLEKANKDLDAQQKKIDAVKQKWKTMGGTVLAVAGAVAVVLGGIDAINNGVDWGNLALMIGGVAAVIGGLYLAFGKMATRIGGVIAGVAILVVGLLDIIKNGPTVQNTILIIGGAIAIAVALATSGISLLVSAIVGVTAAVATFIAGILLEEPAIMSVKEAEEQLAAAKQASQEAYISYTSAVDAAEASAKRLADAEAAAGVTGAELFAQVQAGTLDYANMTAAQKEVLKAYMENEQKQADLKASTEALNEAKKAETLASFENQLALAKESGHYNDYKESVIKAFEEGTLSADEARDLLAKSMSEMSEDAQQAFMKDIPKHLKSGLDPNKYETAGKKIQDWFGNLKKGIINIFSDIGTWFADVGKKIGGAISGAASKAFNWILEKGAGIINGFISGINVAIDIINAIPGVSISKLDLIQVPKLATGGITTGPTTALIGEAGREAVLPLENNTEWMNELADRIAARNGAPSNIVLMLDGKELGHATINSINNITRQTGSLQLVLV